MSYDERRAASGLERQNGALRAGDETQPLVPISPPQDLPPQDDVIPPASPPTTATKNASGRALREIVETVLLALIIFLGVRLVVLNFRVDGSSMFPNLHNGEMLLVNRNAYFHFDENKLLNLLPGEDRKGQHIVYLFHQPRRGDIIVFNPPVASNKPYIKRVIGLAGDHITFRNGYVFVNGQQLNEPYIKGAITLCSAPTMYCDLTVPTGDVFVLGDNRENSSDSRYFGPASIDSIIGKAWITYWPLGDAGFVPHYGYPALTAR